MNYNGDLLLECVNYYLKSNFTEAKLSRLMSNGLLLIDVEKDINSVIQQKTVVIEKEEFISFLRMKKIKQLGVNI